jgi:hypothetical protein
MSQTPMRNCSGIIENPIGLPATAVGQSVKADDSELVCVETQPGCDALGSFTLLIVQVKASLYFRDKSRIEKVAFFSVRPRVEYPACINSSKLARLALRGRSL